jgi:putative heme degradation protein
MSMEKIFNMKMVGKSHLIIIIFSKLIKLLKFLNSYFNKKKIINRKFKLHMKFLNLS